MTISDLKFKYFVLIWGFIILIDTMLFKYNHNSDNFIQIMILIGIIFFLPLTALLLNYHIKLLEFIYFKYFAEKDFIKISKIGRFDLYPAFLFQLGIGIVAPIPFVFFYLFNKEQLYDNYMIILIVLLFLGQFISTFIGLNMHYIPNHSRKLKYNIFMIGNSMASVFLLREASSILIFISLYYAIIYYLLYRFMFKNKEITNFDKNVYTIIKSIPLFLTWVIIQVIGTHYLILRYLIKEKIRNRKIIYLRSFELKDAHLIFSKIIIPVANRVGDVLAVVHKSQTSYETQGGALPISSVSAITLNDNEWKDKIKIMIDNSLAIIIDTRELTPGISWELALIEELNLRYKTIYLFDNDKTLESLDCYKSIPQNLINIINKKSQIKSELKNALYHIEKLEPHSHH